MRLTRRGIDSDLPSDPILKAVRLSRTACAACALAVVHAAHFATYTWQPSDGVTYRQRDTRVVAVEHPSDFDSESPQPPVQYRAQTALTYTTNNAPSSDRFIDLNGYRQGR